MNPDALQKRIAELIGSAQTKRETLEGCTEIYLGSVSILSAVYGIESNQVKAVKIAGELAFKETPVKQFAYLNNVVHIAVGALENLKRELELGLIGNLRLRLTGEVLADLVQMTKSLLGEQGDAAKDVAGVLAAASFEDVIRKLGEMFTDSTGGEKLADVLNALKDKGIIVGPQFTTAQGYLPFRNKALHAEWNAIDRPTVSSALAFIEGLILKHFQ